MPYSIQVFTRREQYEPSVTFYGASGDLQASPASLASNIATALAYVVHQSATFTRWELFDALGKKIDEGPLTGHVGTQGGEIVDPKLFLLVRKNVSGEAEKPSVMYVPFVSAATVQNGVLTGTGATAFAFMAAALLDDVWWNSDGLPIASYTFRHLTRRKKVRRVL